MTLTTRLGTIAALWAAIALVAAPAHALQRPSATTGGGPSLASADAEAVQLLERAARAARTSSYTGVQHLTVFTSDGSITAIADVVHVPGTGSVVRLRETPQTQARRMLAPDVDGDSLAAPTDEEVQLLERQYALTVDNRVHADGRLADVVVVRRHDGTVAARLWLDVASGLLLRREVLDGRQRLVRTSAFVDLAVPARVSGADTPSAETLPAPWGRRVDVVRDRAQLSGLGFQVPETLPGGFALFDARLDDSQGNQVLHLCYSDGLTSLSLFQQRGRLDAAGLAGWKRMPGTRQVWAADGLPSGVVWSARGTVFTVLSDVPPEMVRPVVDALPHRQPRPGLLDRIGHGLARIGSWLNPFA